VIQIYADGVLVSDSRIAAHALQELQVTVSLDKGGTADITMPPWHPAYAKFAPYKTIVTIDRNGAQIFRGRVLYTSDDFYASRTVTCEGERCFLRDAVMRPYLYQTTPKAIFEDLINIYNGQVDADKQFAVGSVTVTDANDYVRLECSSAESAADTVDKLVERCGGYITFGTNADGARVINWLAELHYYSSQKIELGTNLLDFTRNTTNTDLATVLVPYGAPIDDTGERLTIRTVNNGLDYIEDAAAIALRGRIVKAVYWDDVTVATNLLTKARDYLDKAKLLVTTLQLSAVDLSAMDSDIDTFEIGDQIHVKSDPHGLDADFLLIERTYNLLNPAQDAITLGMDVATLTGAQAAAERKKGESIDRVEREAKSDYQKNKDQISGTETRLASLIKQTSDSIESEVSKQQQSLDDLTEAVTTLRQTAESLSATVKTIEEDGVNRVTTITGTTLDKDGLHVTKDGEEMESRIDYSGLHVERNGAAILEATASGVEAENVTVRTYLTIGLHARFEDYSNDRDNARTACFFV
jgi:prophage tail gpP-like protein